jgi:hypothetical protein
MNSRFLRLTLSLVLIAVPAFLVGCGSGSDSGSNFGSGTQDGSVNLIVSDASTEDWATIGVKILSISLIPQGGGTNVNVYTASEGNAPMVNLVQLDQLGEILGNASVPVGTYTGAVITISGNSSDIQLTSSADPSASLLTLCNATTTIPTSQIQVQGTTGSAGSLTVSVTVNFVSNLVVTANTTNALDLEFDLSHPAFIVGHLGGGSAVWAVNFNGPLRHHPIPDVTKFLLRDIYGTVSIRTAHLRSHEIFRPSRQPPPRHRKCQLRQLIQSTSCRIPRTERCSMTWITRRRTRRSRATPLYPRISRLANSFE